MTKNGVPTVLIVDDEIDMRLLVRVVLESAKHGIEVVGEAVDGPAAVLAFENLSPPAIPDVVVLDNRMPGPSGIEVAAEMLAAEPRQHIILFSAFFTPELEAEARELGIAACVSKTDFESLPDLVIRLASQDD
jgi:CheY-like chemotaxis protein